MRSRTAVGGDDPRAPAVLELVVLPLSDGYHLAYYGQALVGGEPINVYVDANSGALLQRYSEFISEIGTGTGAYGDTKKVSSTAASGAFLADDKLRPAEITTYDMKGNLSRMTALFGGAVTPSTTDIALSPNDVWTDSTVVDAQVYAGWYYDYMYKRFGRQGLNGQNVRIALFTHPASLANFGAASTSTIGTYYLNAEFCGSCGPNACGAVEFGDGAPTGYFGGGVAFKPFSAALDVVAHELTHGVTAASARLNGFPFSEAGALNEAFSDMFGVSTAFNYLPPGNAPLQASYTEGRDLTVPGGAFVPALGSYFARSMANPVSTLDPDHYSLRVLGGDPHYNATIATHAFYLAIEGGTNRVSKLPVQGVGAASRDQIEKSFFRALTVLMPSNSNFGLTRLATIQAATDLYGSGSAAVRAITQAWDAVGVQARTTPTAVMLPNPSSVDPVDCSPSFPWLLAMTVSAGTSNLRITEWDLDLYDENGALYAHTQQSASVYASITGYCGPASSAVTAQADSCSVICANVGSHPSGTAQSIFTALDDAGHAVTFATPIVTLLPR